MKEFNSISANVLGLNSEIKNLNAVYIAFLVWNSCKTEGNNTISQTVYLEGWGGDKRLCVVIAIGTLEFSREDDTNAIFPLKSSCH